MGISMESKPLREFADLGAEQLQEIENVLLTLQGKAVYYKVTGYRRKSAAELRLLTASGDTIAIKDRVVTLEGHGDWVAGLAFHPQGTHLATGAGDGVVKIWSATHDTLAGARLAKG